jgi:hypothetical protein
MKELETEFSEAFIQKMRNAMIVSYHKYGPVAEAYPNRVDALGSLEKRLERYRETGNTEWLVDIANFAMIEFMHPRKIDAHYRPTDSHESPGRVRFDNQAADARNHDHSLDRLHYCFARGD